MPTHGIRPNANTVIRPNATPPSSLVSVHKFLKGLVRSVLVPRR